MKIERLFKILKAYSIFIIPILIFEIYYFIGGYKGNGAKKINLAGSTDNIPCPYFFLYKIKKFIIRKKINSLIDLGCGLGRVLYFFRKKTKIRYYHGVEYDKPSYEKCKKLFHKGQNVVITNSNFMSFHFLKLKNECFFLNDPLTKKKDFEKLILKILKNNKRNSKTIYFILVNVNKKKREVFHKYEMIESYQINDRGYYIYSNKKYEKKFN